MRYERVSICNGSLCMMDGATGEKNREGNSHAHAIHRRCVEEKGP
jgi:hypothetical protein